VVQIGRVLPLPDALSRAGEARHAYDAQHGLCLVVEIESVEIAIEIVIKTTTMTTTTTRAETGGSRCSLLAK